MELYILVRLTNAAVTIFNETRPPDLKPSNILLLPSNVDSVVMHELVEFPSTLYEIPKTISPEEVPFQVVSSAPLMFTSDFRQGAQLHWVITDFGHGT